MYSTEDHFNESDEWIAAEVRQLFRAHHANDTKGVEVALFYFKDYLTKTLHRHLRSVDSAWGKSTTQILESGFDLSRLWFDGLSADPEYVAPGRLRLRGEVAWVQGQEHWYYDPFDFEIQLCPTTGVFQGYVIRFGDHRSLSEKVPGASVSAVPVGGWAYQFERGCLESGERQ